MEKIARMKAIIGFLTLACIGLIIAVILLAVKDKAEPAVTVPTLPVTVPTLPTLPPTTSNMTATSTTTPGTTTEKLTPGVITDANIRSLTEELLISDTNNMASYITINEDADPDAGEKLLELEDGALNCDTIQALLSLYDNFKASVNVDENLDNEYVTEKEEFLDLIMKSDVMKITEEWMIFQGILDGNNQTLRESVDQIWFTPYAGSHSTSGVNDSTGFEHTFVGQMNGDKVLGLHNWVRFHDLEQAGNLTFIEFFNQTIFDGDDVNRGSVVKISYDWEDASKHSGTMFVGTSPELEMALYTVCYFARPNGKCPVQLNDKQFTITTMDYNHLGVISVANPNI